MTKLKKLCLASISALVLLSSSMTVFAASYNSPAEAVAGITNKTVEEVIEERTQSGKSFGTIANEADKLDEFHEAILEMRKEQLDTQVQSGRITRAQADALIETMRANQLTCDGLGNGICNGTGLGQCGTGGNQNGMGRGQGRYGSGLQSGNGGVRLQNGSCYTR